MMDLSDFQRKIQRNAPEALARQYLREDTVHVLPTPESYTSFKDTASKLFPGTETVAIAGSGNWGYSLNPEKLWNAFGDQSDVDVVLISDSLFHETWELIRKFHRTRWYTISAGQQDKLLRRGQDIYAGFASPTWLPIQGHQSVYEFKSRLNTLSKEVDYRDVTAMFFRNEIEAVDYYQRGFRNALGRLNK